MYLSLKELGRETLLVVYPDEYTSSRRPPILRTWMSATLPGMRTT
jgi:hypothetical protein